MPIARGANGGEAVELLQPVEKIEMKLRIHPRPAIYAPYALLKVPGAYYYLRGEEATSQKCGQARN